MLTVEPGMSPDSLSFSFVGALKMNDHSFADELAGRSVGVRLSFRWVGNSKAVDTLDNSAAAELFQANPRAIKLSKKLFDANRPEYKAVQAVKGKIRRYWVDNTLPYVERGVRLLRRVDAAKFAAAVDELAAELAAAVADLESVFQDLLTESRERLGSLFNRTDYPATLIGEFSAAVEFPELSPPNYLATISPELYERESGRVAARFDQAVEMAERAFSDELAALVGRLVDRLEPDQNGQPKIFRDSTIENFREFIGRFRRLSIGSSAELDRLVAQAADLVGGVRPAEIREPGESRERLRAGMSAIADELAAGIVNRPARVIRFAAAQAVEPAAELAAAAQDEPPAAELERQGAATEPAAAAQDEPERISFVLNYGGGLTRRIAVAANPAAAAVAAVG